MNAKLLIEGKEFDIEILDPKLQELLAPSKKKTGYERVGKSEIYYYSNGDGSTDDIYESQDCVDDGEYDGANYYSDKTVAENNSRADKLMRQLRRFAVEHREKEFDWKQIIQDKWFIYYDYDSENIEATCDDYTKTFGTIYFDSMVVVDDAINTFRDELLWYFTEYKDSL